MKLTAEDAENAEITTKCFHSVSANFCWCERGTGNWERGTANEAGRVSVILSEAKDLAFLLSD